MNRTLQNSLALILTLIFIIAVPIIILYAMGYRLGRGLNDNPTLTSTGGIRVNTRIPYLVELNDQPAVKSPLLKVGMPPQDITVTLSLPGYHPWVKKLTIQPYLVQLINEVTLFPKDPQLTEIANTQNTNAIRPIPNTSFLVYTSYDPQFSGLWLYNMATKTNIQLTNSLSLQGSVNQDYLDIMFDSSGETMFFKTSIQNSWQYFIVSQITSQPRLINITPLLAYDTKINPIRPIALEADTLYLAQGGHLFQILDGFSSLSSIILSDIDYIHIVKDVAYYTSSQQPNLLQILTLSNREQESIPLPTNKKISSINISPNQSHLLMIDTDQAAWFIPLSNRQTSFRPIQQGNIQSIQLGFDSKRALIQASNSLALLYLDNIENYQNRQEGDYELLYTTNQAIRQASIWAGNPEYILFIENSSLKVIESDTRSNLNLYTLTEQTKAFASFPNRNQAEFVILTSDNRLVGFNFPIRTALLPL